MAAKFPPLPTGQRFTCIAADPPWRFKDQGTRASPAYRGKQRASGKHYSVLSFQDICELPVEEIAAPDAWLLLWCPTAMIETMWTDYDGFLQQGLHRMVAKAWGFTPAGSVLVWVKGNPILVDEFGKRTTLSNKRRPVAGASFQPHIGLGHYARNAHETCIICKRGKPKRVNGGLPSVIFAPRTKHSAKPEAFYTWAEQFAAGPRIDLFGRGTRSGWYTWGLEGGGWHGGEEV